MINDCPDNKKLTTKHDYFLPIELTTTRLDSEDRHEERQTITKDVHVRTDLTITTLENEPMNEQLYVIDKDILLNIGISRMNVNSEEILDLTNLETSMEDSESAMFGPIANLPRIVESQYEVPYIRTMNTTDTIIANLGPIVGYAQEPLLPLFQACAPLNDILHNLSFYVQMALNKTPKVPPDGLTVDESAAIRLYTMEWKKPHRSLYSMLNYTLKNNDREHLRPYFMYLKLLLTALVKLPCLPPTTIWRGVTKDLGREFLPGTLVTWWSFSSCTSALSVLENRKYLGNYGDRTLFSIEVINGRALHAHSQFAHEDEILLLPGTHMEVQSILSPALRLHVIHLKQIKPEEVLLEPPFEGAILYPELKRHWYRKKRFIIPLSLLAIVIISAIILGSVLRTKSRHNLAGTT